MNTYLLGDHHSNHDDLIRAQSADVLVTHTGPSWLAPPRSGMVDYYAAAEAAIGTCTRN